MTAGKYRRNRYLELAESRFPAPPFSEPEEWIGVAAPLRLEDLRGKVCLFHFWTSSCVACLPVLDEVQALQREFGAQIQVVGIHVDKFPAERQSEVVARTVAGLGIDYPVLNVHSIDLTQAYGITTLPALAVVDPDGCVVEVAVGEGQEFTLGTLLADTIEYFAEQRSLRPLPAASSGAKAAAEPRPCPGRLAVEPATGIMAVSLPANHQVLLLQADGSRLAVIGQGSAGRIDGEWQQAAFNRPQGLTFWGSTRCVVADSGNHQIRLIDLERRTVTTIAGTGQREYEPRRLRSPALAVGLNYPWAVAAIGESLFIALAGNHQIWRQDLAAGWIEPFIGNGGENLRDGYRTRALLTRPAGLAVDAGERLYFTDAENSAVRYCDLPSGEVHTLVGTGLYECGSGLGDWAETSLQFPQGVVWEPGRLLVADSYNQRIVELDLDLGRSRCLLAGLREPSDIALLPGGKMAIADNRRLQLLDRREGAVQTVWSG